MNISHSLTGKHILVTGGTGYLASNLIAQLQNTDCLIIRVDLPGASFKPLSGKAQLRDIEGDIRKRALWETILTDVDVIFHFAAQTSAYIAEQNPPADLDINVMPMLHLLDICREKVLIPSILFSGTVTEAGLPKYLPVNEDHPDHPITVYDLHKWIAENYLKYYVRTGVLRGAVLRLANVYGPGPKSSSTDRGVLNLMVRKALLGESLTVYGQGDYLRDYIYIEDVTRAFLQAAANIDLVSGQHFVLGTGEGYTVSQAINLVAERVAVKTGKHASVVNIEPPDSLSPIEQRNFIADTRRFAQATGWKAKIHIIEGIDRTIDYFLSEQESL